MLILASLKIYINSNFNKTKFCLKFVFIEVWIIVDMHRGLTQTFPISR